jgi:hypothetical protein
MKRIRNLAVCVAILAPTVLVNAISGCSSSSPTPVNTGGDSGTGAVADTGSPTTTDSGPGTTNKDGGVTCNAQFAAATCAQCAACLAPYCCSAINACYADPGCTAELNCENNCYNAVLPDGGPFPSDDGGDGAAAADLQAECLTACEEVDAGASSAALYAAQDNCYNGTGPGNAACNTATNAPCDCN